MREERFRLLVADDEMIERAALCKTLQKLVGDRCELFLAANGREAIRIHQEKKIQIAILDIEMPGINGIQAAEEIRKTDRDCCIIFLTAFDEFAYAKKAITVRALDYLLKPYQEKELLMVLEEAMRQWSGEDRQVLPETGGELLQEERGSVSEMIASYIRENYMYELSMQELARRMNYSEAYFCKLFKQSFGQNFISYLTDIRIEEAKRLLEQPTMNVKEVGRFVGYGDANYFAKVFKRSTGQSPTEYRQSIL